MSNDFDYDLTADQWEALKALRNPVAPGRLSKAYVIGDLIRLGLVSIMDGVPVLTKTGRTALVRGSCRLLDVAA